ncbi:DUF4232 domain-containing protein [Streptomyces sp. NPDC045431]|uniref:DUF4232 domain-containing protein n=1 Tax=Streptomyces sp. NPDC045431 TaxID=3155613 RepID=UPI0033C4B37C
MHAAAARKNGKNWKSYTLGIVAVATLLSTTACEPGGTDPGTGGTSSGTPSATGSAKPSQSSVSPSADPTAPPKPTASAEPTAAVPCSDENVTITATAEPRDELRHLLLTAVNNGDRPCTLYHHPTVTFENDSLPPVVPMESPTRGLATIGPKQKAYAGLLLYRVEEKVATVETLTVGFQGRVPNTEAGNPISAELPTGVTFFHVGSNPQVTLWNKDLKAVQRYMFAR